MPDSAHSKKYHSVLLVFKGPARGYDGDQWNFVEAKYIIMENLLNWYNQDGLEYYGDPISEEGCYKYF